MKKIVYLSNLMLLIITTNVYATNYIPGPYLGCQAGWGRIDEGKGYQQWADNQPEGGGAYLNTKIDCTIAPNSQKQSNNAIRPTYGAGITFNFTDNIAMDASWTGIYGKNRINSYTNNATLVASNPTPSANLFTLGLYYKFTRI